MSERRPYVAANWKMHKTISETGDFLGELHSGLPRLPADGPEVVICPPFLSLAVATEFCDESTVKVAAQNMHEAGSGAFTGEISAPMLVEIGVDAVILGHSERRQYFGETDQALAAKVAAALEAGLEPILCVGETQAQREAGETDSVLEEQLTADLSGIPFSRIHELVIAYEPIWAIGTGLTATPEQAQETISDIRNVINRLGGDGDRTRIIYGGSVKPGNAAELLGQEDVDGALIGGASLEVESLIAIVRAAS